MAELVYLSRTIGGHDRRWITTLEEAGHRVEVLSLDRLEDPVARITSRGRPVDAIVAGPLTDALPAAVEADVAPVLALCWGFDLILESAASDVRDRMVPALNKAAGVHVDCRALADEVVAMGVDPARVSVGAWGIDTGLFTPGEPETDLRRLSGWPTESRVILTTRTWAPLYDVDVVLRGFAQAYERDPSLRLAWAGEGPEEGRLRRLVVDLGIRDVVRETGRLQPDALREWLRSSDLYVSAATSDGSSLSLLEALAVGVPAVVSDLPGNREWVVDDDFGALFPVGSVKDLAERIADVLERGSSAEQRASRHRRILQHGDWNQNRAVFLAALERVLR